MPRPTRQPTIWFEGRPYFDDRLFIVEVCRAIVTNLSRGGKAARWCVTTRRNTPPYPPWRDDDFDTREEAIAYLESIEPLTPRISLGGRAPDPVPTLVEHRAWLESIGAEPPYIEPEPDESGRVWRVFYGDEVRYATVPRFRLRPAWPVDGHLKATINNIVAADLFWRVEPWSTAQRFFENIQTLIEDEDRQWPWAIVVYDRAYPLGNWFEADPPDPAGIVGWGFTPKTGPRMLTGILVFDPAELERLAGIAPLYTEPYELLKRWKSWPHKLCLPSPLDPEWVREAAASVGVDPPRR